MNKHIVPWIVVGIFGVIILMMSVSIVTLQQDLNIVNGDIAQYKQNTDISGIQNIPTLNVNKIVPGYCPEFTLNNNRTAVLADGIPSSLVALAQDEVISEIKLSTDCKYLVWSSFAPQKNPDGTSNWEMKATFTDVAGSANAHVVFSALSGLPSVPEAKYGIEFGDFAPDRLVFFTSMMGDNSPGPGYYSAGTVFVNVYDPTTKTMQELGSVIARSTDGRWAQIKKEMTNTFSLVDLKTGVVFGSHNDEKGPAFFDYMFSPTGTYLVHQQIPGKENQYGMNYKGPSSIYMQKFNGVTWSEPVVVASVKSGEPYYNLKFTTESTLYLSKDGKNYSLDLETKKLK